LVEQWEKEARSFNFQDIIKIASKFNWEGNLATELSNQKYTPTSFILISTYASFTKPQFQKYIKQLPTDAIFIADEGHNISSPSVLKCLPEIKIKKRKSISYTYAFSMEKAIKEGVLCKYNYYPHIVKLTTADFKGYIGISARLAQLYNNAKGELEKNDLVEKLLLKRKRIIHKAENKLEKAVAILNEQFRVNGNLRYTFVYVPEGITTDLAEIEEETLPDNIRIIDQYTRAIGRISDRVKVNKFISGMSDRDEILSQFQAGHIQVLASMKCLDEGVDIPRAERTEERRGGKEGRVSSRTEG